MDFDKAYDNRAHAGNAEEILEGWQNDAQAYREQMAELDRGQFGIRYGEEERELYDLFLPKNDPTGVVIFVHGGYWRALDRNVFSHLANGPVENGWAVAVVQYTLAPQAHISAITQQICGALKVIAGEHDGPLRLIGHSAGGHLVTRMLCKDVELPGSLRGRIVHTMAVSGLNDLAPLMKTAMNDDLQLDPEEVRSESPIHLKPTATGPLTCWVGADELPEFVRQNEMLQEHWKDSDLDILVHREPGCNHFTVIDDLTKPDSHMTTTLLQRGG